MADIAQAPPPVIDQAPAIVDAPITASTPLFRIRPFRLLFITRVSSTTAVQMLAVVVGWHVYELTNSALQLGMIGLVQVLPPLVLMLAAGQVADRYDRRLVLRCCYVVAFCSAAGLVLVAALPQPSIPAIYVLLLVNASARVFEQPVMQALVPVMAPKAVLNRAIAAHVSARQLSVLIASLGGILYVFGPAFDYGSARCCSWPPRRRACAWRARPPPPLTPVERDTRPGRLPLHRRPLVGAGRHAARSGVHAVRRRQCAAADLRARHPRGRRLGPALRSARRWAR